MLQNHQNMNLVLSTDAKPRLKWTTELHQRFVEAVNQLGGADKATPKSLMRIMGITGLTLYHLKSHLQKYRLGKSQQSETSDQINLEDFNEIQRKDEEKCDGNQSQMNDQSLKISETLQLQLEVQKKLHEQIEVQRHLQLRIEAQGKYLQSVLRKAQESIAGYGCSSAALERAKAELSQLASMVNSGCQSCSFSELTESGELNFNDIERKEMRGAMCSMESSLTSSETSGSGDEKQTTIEIEEPRKYNELSLLEVVRDLRSGRKRKESSICDDLLSSKRCTIEKESDEELRYIGGKMIDLNSQFDHDKNDNDTDSDEAVELEPQLIEYL